MMTVIGMILKDVFSKIASAFAWAVENWRVSLPILGVVLLVFAYNHHRSVVAERDQLATTLKAYTEEAEKAKEQRQKENANKEKRYKAEEQKTKAEHQEHINQIARAYYETIKQKDAAIASASAMRTSLRKDIETFTAASRLSESAGGSVRLTGSGEDHDTACARQTDYINTLEYACAITTADYNTLYDRCKAVNTIYGATQP